MTIKTNSNIVSGVIFAIISAVFYLLIPSQIVTYETSEINAQTIPTLVISLIFIFSVLLIITGFMEPKKEYHIGLDWFKGVTFKQELKTMCFILMLFVYALIFEFAGFIISSLLLAVGVLLYYRVRKWYFYLIAIGNVGIIYVVFGILLNVSLP